MKDDDGTAQRIPAEDLAHGRGQAIERATGAKDEAECASPSVSR